MNYCARTGEGAALPKADPAIGQAEILIATTGSCNLKCSYCFVRQRDLFAADEQMTPQVAERVVDALHNAFDFADSISLHLYGGEPLCNLPALRALVLRASLYPPGRFRFAITTNGVVASDEVFELFEIGKFQVILSIDGPADIHDQCRRTVEGLPTHARVMEFLEKLRTRTHCWVRGSSVVRSGWGLSAANNYLRHLPVDAIKAQALRGPAETPHTLTSDEMGSYFTDLEKIGSQVIEEITAGIPPKDDRFSSRVLQLLKGERRESFCGAGRTVFGITPRGGVKPCVLLDDSNRLGHIDDDPPRWIDAGRQWVAQYRQRLECRTCDALPLCGGGCPALMPVCGENECDIIRKNCEIARGIYEHFREEPEALLVLAGIT